MTWGKRRAIVIVVVIVVLIVLGCVGSRWSHRMRHVARNSVLVIDAEGQIDEQRPFSFFGSVTGNIPPVLHDYLDAIDSAAKDSRIEGIVVRIAPLATGWGKIEEIRTHLLDFQKSGKPSICYLGYDGAGNQEYYLATACREIWLVPTNPVDIKGLMAEALFFRGTLDKLHIVPQFYHIAEYKTYSNMFTEKKFTPAHREEVESILESIYGQYVEDASTARHMTPFEFEAIVKSGPLLASEAVQKHVVDRLAYWDQVQDYFKQRRGHEWHPVSLGRYAATLQYSTFTSGPEIAVVHATGTIISGRSEPGSIMGSDSVAYDLRTAREDSDVKAIVLRVDSGGGSVVGSEIIRREVELARRAKPLVVSMSDVAASGGYWISSPATKIVADPDTLTGSIGVVAGKFNAAGLYNMLGVTSDYLTTSDNATLFSDQQNFTPQQAAYMQKSLNEIYAQFTKGVAEGRGMSVGAVDAIAKGRVWSGADAKKLGLVDELGGIDRAIAVAKELANIPSSEQVSIVRFPKEKNFFEQLFEHENDMNDDDSRTLEGILRRVAGDGGTMQARLPYELVIR